MDVQDLLRKYQITPDPLKDQFFLMDEKIINKIIKLAELNKKDVVLEIGVGIGNLTRKLAKKADKVIAFEIDEKFKPTLADLPKNVEMHFENAWDFIQLHGKWKKKKEYNKVVANLPYSFCEPFLHNLTFLEYDKVILLIPVKFADKIESNPVFGSFFKADKKLFFDKNKFYPIPRTDSVVIDLKKLSDPIEQKDLTLFLRQYLYQHEPFKIKNILREGLIKFVWLIYQKRLTKNQARKIISESGIDKNLLEKQPDNPKIYAEVSKIELNLI